jgi:hypothetical protein
LGDDDIAVQLAGPAMDSCEKPLPKALYCEALMAFSSNVRCLGSVRRNVEVAKAELEGQACRPVWRRLARLTFGSLLWLDLTITAGFRIFLQNILEGFAACGAAMYCADPCAWREAKDSPSNEGDRGTPDAGSEGDSAP